MHKSVFISHHPHTMNILIVEDNPLMRGMIRETVSEFAEIITECADGDEAFAAYQAHLPTWVLMDIQMPRVDGFTASRQIKTAYPEANICIVTDYGDAQTRRAAIEVGAAAFVLKENLEELSQLFGAVALNQSQPMASRP
jgi:CheY-like chemotaxis protein